MFRNFFFDYFFFRFCQVSSPSKEDIKDYPPVIVITLIQAEFIGGIVAAIIRSFLDRNQTAPYAKLIAGCGVILGGIILILNYIKYTGKFEEIATQFDSESKRDRAIKGWLIMFAIILSMVPLYIIGTYF